MARAFRGLMLRVIVAVACVLVVAIAAWAVVVSVDRSAPFSELGLTGLRLDARAAGDGTGRVLVSFAWQGPARGRCTRVRGDVVVAVGGVPATTERLGGGRWVPGPVVGFPRHVCDNQAVFSVDGRRLGPGIVAAAIADGGDNPALISAADLLVPPALVVESPQPARVGHEAVLAVLPDSHTLAMWPTVDRGFHRAWPVDIDGHRARFQVPPAWSQETDGEVRVFANRTATPIRCERALSKQPPCTAMALSVDSTVPFTVKP